MQLEGLKVQIKGEDGIFTVGKMIVNSNNPLNCQYQVIDANGNDELFTSVRNFLPVVGDDFTIDWHSPPHRRLRKIPAPIALTAANSPPHRRLRKVDQEALDPTVYSPPHRRLRKGNV